jgi:hypothetical protein
MVGKCEWGLLLGYDNNLLPFFVSSNHFSTQLQPCSPSSYLKRHARIEVKIKTIGSLHPYLHNHFLAV